MKLNILNMDEAEEILNMENEDMRPRRRKTETERRDTHKSIYGTSNVPVRKHKNRR